MIKISNKKQENNQFSTNYNKNLQVNKVNVYRPFDKCHESIIEKNKYHSLSLPLLKNQKNTYSKLNSINVN